MTRFRFACLFVALLTSTTARAEIVLETPFFEGGSGKAYYLLAAREYEKVRPGVKVDMYLDPRIAEKVQVRLLEGDFPEITNPGTINYWPLIDNGDVVQVDEYLDGPSWDTFDADGKPVKWGDTFLPGSLETYARDGKHYGIPLGYYAYVFWYNKKMFREHGWTKARTWDELFELCKQVKYAGSHHTVVNGETLDSISTKYYGSSNRAGDIRAATETELKEPFPDPIKPGFVVTLPDPIYSAMAFQGRYPYYATFLYDSVTYHLTGLNGYLARQNLAPGAIAAPESVRGIGITRRLAENYFQPGALGMSHTESQLQFFLGKTAMIPCGAWLKSEMLGKIPDGFELGCFNLPHLDESIADKTAVRVAAEPCITFSKSKHPREAMDFLRFMTSKKMAGIFCKMQDIPCAVRGANEGNLSKDLAELNEIVSAAKSSYGATPGGGHPEMFQVYNDMLYDVIANTQMTPRQIADKYEERGQNIRRRKMEPDKVKVNHLWQPIAFLGLLGVGGLFLAWRVAAGLALRGKRRRIQTGVRRMSITNVMIFVAPALILYTAFVIIPSARSFSWSLHSWNGLTNMDRMPFVGLQNFKRLLLESSDFWNALKNNLWLMFVIPLFVVPLAMFLAASISRGVWGAKLFRIVFFFPNMLGGVAATLLWLHLYNPNGGLVNSALDAIGIDSFKNFTWLEPKNLYWALIPISIWGTVGFNMVLYLAAMEGVDETYYEAATIDGASKWRQFWTITVPLIWDVIVISLVFLIIGGMKAFDIIFLLSNQRPQGDAHVIATRMVQTMFYELRVGEAAAIAVLLFLMVFIGTAATMRGLRRETVEQ